MVAKYPNSQFLIGGSDEEKEGIWRWASDGAVFTDATSLVVKPPFATPGAPSLPPKGPISSLYTNWAADEVPGHDHDKNCLRMMPGGQWKADSCSEGNYVICETSLIRGRFVHEDILS